MEYTMSNRYLRSIRREAARQANGGTTPTADAPTRRAPRSCSLARTGRARGALAIKIVPYIKVQFTIGNKIGNSKNGKLVKIFILFHGNMLRDCCSGQTPCIFFPNEVTGRTDLTPGGRLWMITVPLENFKSHISEVHGQCTFHPETKFLVSLAPFPFKNVHFTVWRQK